MRNPHDKRLIFSEKSLIVFSQRLDRGLRFLKALPAPGCTGARVSLGAVLGGRDRTTKEETHTESGNLRLTTDGHV